MMSIKFSCIIMSLIIHAWAQSTDNPEVRAHPCRRVGFSARKAIVDGNNRIDSARGSEDPVEISFRDTLSSFGDPRFDGTRFCSEGVGYFFFSFHAMSSNKGNFKLALMYRPYHITAAAYGGNRRQVTGTEIENYQSAGNSAMLHLTFNECVWLELQEGSIYEHPGNEAYTTFTGYLVQPADYVCETLCDDCEGYGNSTRV